MECLTVDSPGPAVASVAVRAARPAATGRVPRVLVADDEPDIREGLRDPIEDSGFVFEGTDTGRRTIARVVSDPPNLLLLDIMFPDIDGIHVLRTIRRWEGTEALPVIAITAARTAETVKSAVAGGVRAFVAKPFALEALLAQITAVVRETAPTFPAPLVWEERPEGGAWRIGPFARLGAAEAGRALRLAAALREMAPAPTELDLAGAEVLPDGLRVLAEGAAVAGGLRFTGLDRARGGADLLAALRLATSASAPAGVSASTSASTQAFRFERSGRDLGILHVAGRLEGTAPARLREEARSRLFAVGTLVLVFEETEPDDALLDLLVKIAVEGKRTPKGRSRIHFVLSSATRRLDLSLRVMPHSSVFSDVEEARRALS